VNRVHTRVSFCNHWIGKKEAPEAKLAEAYRKAQADFEVQQNALLRCLRIEKKGDKLIPVFSSEAATLAGLHWDAEKRLLDIASDINAFMDLTGGETSLTILADELERARRQVSDAEHGACNVLARAIRRGAGSVAEAEQSPDVQAAFDKRDRVKSDMQPEIARLEKKLEGAKAILNKYR